MTTNTPKTQHDLQQEIVKAALGKGNKEVIPALLGYNWEVSFSSLATFEMLLVACSTDTPLLVTAWKANTKQRFTPLSVIPSKKSSTPEKETSFIQVAISHVCLPLISHWLSNKEITQKDLEVFYPLFHKKAIEDDFWKTASKYPANEIKNIKQLIEELKDTYERLRWVKETTPHGWRRYHRHAPFKPEDLEIYIQNAPHCTQALLANLLVASSFSEYATLSDPKNILSQLSPKRFWDLCQQYPTLIWNTASLVQQDGSKAVVETWKNLLSQPPGLSLPLSFMQKELDFLTQSLKGKTPWRTHALEAVKFFQREFESINGFEALMGAVHCQFLIDKTAPTFSATQKTELLSNFPKNFKPLTEVHEVWGVFLAEYANALSSNELIEKIPLFRQSILDIPQDDKSKGQFLRTMWRVLREEEDQQKRAALNQLLWTGVCTAGPKTLRSWINRYNETQKVVSTHSHLDMSYPFPRYDLFEDVLKQAMEFRLDPISQKTLMSILVTQQVSKPKTVSLRKM